MTTLLLPDPSSSIPSTTLAQARAQLLQHLDDAKGRRFAQGTTPTSGADYTFVDRALRVSVQRCVDDYANAGGERFSEVVKVTTSAADGSASLAQYKPADVVHVLSEPFPNNLFPIDEADVGVGGLPDLTARPLRVYMTRRIELPPEATDSDPLVPATAGRSWEAFDAWVIARAAWTIGLKDKEGQAGLGDLVAELQAGAIGQPRIPKSYDWPMPDNRPRLLRRLRWTFEHSSQQLRLMFDPIWRW